MALIVMVLALLRNDAAAPRLDAVVTWAEGTITVAPNTPQRNLVRVLKAGGRIAAGEVVHIPRRGKVVLVCSTDRWVSVSGPRKWILDQKSCGQGRKVTAGSYRELVAEGGRIRSLPSGVVIEMTTRTAEEGLVPVLLMPRHTFVVDPRPTLVWTRVPDATAYQIEWLGDTSPIRIARDEARCSAGSGPFRGLDICTAPYPADRPPLAPGRAVYVAVACRTDMVSPWRGEENPVRIELLSPAEQEALRQRLDAIAAIPAEADARRILIAGAYAASGVLHEAWQRYAISDTPAAWVTAGDLAVEMELDALAIRDYGRALEQGSPAERAAAEYGLGRLAMARRRFKEAHGHFERALQGFVALKLTGEEEQARAGLETAAARLRERESQ